MAYSFFFAEQKHSFNNLYGQHQVVSCLIAISIARIARTAARTLSVRGMEESNTQQDGIQSRRELPWSQEELRGGHLRGR
jgi:hypothetical protein